MSSAQPQLPNISLAQRHLPAPAQQQLPAPFASRPTFPLFPPPPLPFGARTPSSHPLPQNAFVPSGFPPTPPPPGLVAPALAASGRTAPFPAPTPPSQASAPMFAMPPPQPPGVVVPRVTSTVAPASATEKKKKKDGLEECTRQLLRFLQQRGKATFKEIHEALDIDYRRAYDILNVLMTTPLVRKEGKKRDPSQPYAFVDGTPLPQPIDMDRILSLIETEQRSIIAMSFRTEKLATALATGARPDPVTFLETLRAEEQALMASLPAPGPTAAPATPFAPPAVTFPTTSTSAPAGQAQAVAPTAPFPPTLPAAFFWTTSGPTLVPSYASALPTQVPPSTLPPPPPPPPPPPTLHPPQPPPPHPFHPQPQPDTLPPPFQHNVPPPPPPPSMHPVHRPPSGAGIGNIAV